ncbi:hypothetical protein [Actinosynnema sp. NPDC020468]|uniref:hypothetical protein n=1 Tax=Actinosynnema sp. NPDC020468 TaxID=3154488 RepID=UPI0033D6F6CA
MIEGAVESGAESAAAGSVAESVGDGANPLRELVGRRAYWVWSATAQLCRAPVLMAAMAFSGLMLVTGGRPEDGGVLVASLVLAQVFVAGAAGRVFDRRPGRVLPAVATGVAAVALGLVAVTGVSGAPLWASCLCAAVAGVALAGLPGLARDRLNVAVPRRLVEPALAVDATVVELLVVGAPLVVSAVLLIGAAGGVVAMAVTAAAAGALLALGPRAARPVTAEGTAGGVLWSPAFLAWLAVSFAFGHALGAIETAALTLAGTLDAGVFGGGAIIAILSVAGIASGLGYAALGGKLPGGPRARAAVLLLVVAAATVAVGRAGSWPTLAVAVVLVGLGAAPLNAIRSYAVEQLVPDSRRTEGFSWLYTANGLGFAVSGLGLSWLPLWLALAVPAASCVAGVLLLGATRGRT